MTLTQRPISTDGVSIDLDETAARAARKVKRNDHGEPIHACGAEGHRGCPCWRCTKSECAACAADM